MLELWKPLILKDKNNPIIFDEIGYELEYLNLLPNGPGSFIFFYDEQENFYYYLKRRSATFTNFENQEIWKKILDNEIIIKNSENDGKNIYYSYIDCSRIFKINANSLEFLVNKENDLFKKTKKLSDENINKIKNNIKKNMMKSPPYLSIIEVKLNEKGETYGECLYLHKEILTNYIINNDDPCAYDEEFDYDQFDSFKSNELPKSNQRYKYGISLCLKILNEYFPDEVNNFLKAQDYKISK